MTHAPMCPVARLPLALLGSSQQHAEPHLQTHAHAHAHGSLDLKQRHPAQPGVSLVPEHTRGALGQP